jgi:hypothetical protein
MLEHRKLEDALEMTIIQFDSKDSSMPDKESILLVALNV